MKSTVLVTNNGEYYTNKPPQYEAVVTTNFYHEINKFVGRVVTTNFFHGIDKSL